MNIFNAYCRTELNFFGKVQLHPRLEICYSQATFLISFFQVKQQIEQRAEKKTRALAWLGLGMMGLQFGVLARLTWWEYSWDIMEPVTYFVTYGTTMAMFAYYVCTKQVTECIGHYTWFNVNKMKFDLLNFKGAHQEWINIKLYEMNKYTITSYILLILSSVLVCSENSVVLYNVEYILWFTSEASPFVYLRKTLISCKWSSKYGVLNPLITLFTFSETKPSFWKPETMVRNGDDWK